MNKTYYIIYKTTNKVNNKYYIGKHQTINLNDGYMGSGKLLKRAITKYGIENFVKEILHIFDNEKDMNQKEKDLVIVSEQTYNLCEGGKGGFGYINKYILTKEDRIKSGKAALKTIKEKNKIWGKGSKHSQETKFKFHLAKSGKNNPLFGKLVSTETRNKISKTKKLTIKKELYIGANNSQFGTMWITNGINNKKTNKKDIIPEGYYKGRIYLGRYKKIIAVGPVIQESS